ncbi:MAG: hypothetical protein EBU35_14605, partial [Marivivens sp.]|nr:hypothetical protein [Marivivens sp.]
ATTRRVNQEFLDNIEADDPRLNDVTWVGPVALTWQGRLGYETDGRKTSSDCIEYIPDPWLRDKLPEWVEQIDGCDNTTSALRLARKIAKEMRDHQASKPKEEEEEQSSEQDDEETSQEDGETSSSEGEQGDGSEDKQGEDKTEQKLSGGEDNDGEEKDSDGEEEDKTEEFLPATEDAVDPEPYDPDLGKLINKVLKDDGLLGSSRSYRPICGFSNAFKNRKTKTYGNDDRWEPLTFQIFKPFAKRLFSCRASLATIYGNAGGNNSDPDAILIAADMLRARPEDRRILLVLSDGQPNWRTYNAWARREYLKDVVRDVNAEGIETIGIGINSDAVSHYYPKHVVVRNIDDLATTAMEQLAQTICGKRLRVAA